MANLVIGVTGLLISLFGLIQVRKSILIEQRTRLYLYGFFTVLMLYVSFNLMGQLSLGRSGPAWRVTTMVSLFFESALSAALIPLLTSFLLYSCGEDASGRNPAILINRCLTGIYIGLLVYTQFSKTIYYFDGLNGYHRGPWYPVLLIPPVLMMLVNLHLLRTHRSRLSSRRRTAFAIYILVPAASMVIQMLFYGIYVIVLGSSIAVAAMLTYILNDQTELFYRQEAEIARLKNEILLSQIQPHFVINTLGAIAHLCQNSPEARQAIQTFSRYIRGNIEALTTDAVISFEQELEHTRQYLSLEKLRFGDSLQVEWSLECTGFSIPTLTLQPLVENAVRYGVRKKPDGRGTVRIMTRETVRGYEIRVEDDGPGFDPEAEPEDGRCHIGLANVQERLRSICGGSLEIQSEPGRGTVAAILLPGQGGRGEKP